MAYIYHKHDLMEYILDIDEVYSPNGVKVAEVGRSVPKSGKVVEKRADRNQIHFILGGVCTFSCGGETAKLSCGDAASVRMGEEYCETMLECGESHRHLWINYTGDPYPELPRFFSFAPYKTRVSDAFDGLFGNPGETSDFRMLSVFYGILALIKSGTPRHDSENAYVAECRRYIRANYAAHIGLSDAAAHLGITPKYLSRIFSRETGTTFGEYLTHTRLSVAEAELCRDCETVENVARSVGYSDPLYFSRVFKKHCGVPPSEYGKR